MPKTHLIVLIFLMFGFVTRADSKGLFQEGINAYQQNQWDVAREKFTLLLDDKEWKFAAAYNLGNVAARQKRFGEALGFYKRALSLKPHDPDTIFNFEYVKGVLGDRRLFGRPGTLDILRSEILPKFTFAESLIAVFFSSFLFLLYLLRFVKNYKAALTDGDQPSVLPSPTTIIFGSLFFALTSLSVLKLIETYTEKGIVTAVKADLRSGPGETNASMLELPEGVEVNVKDTHNNWYQVALPGGLTGWIPQSSLMITSGGGPW